MRLTGTLSRWSGAAGAVCYAAAQPLFRLRDDDAPLRHFRCSLRPKVAPLKPPADDDDGFSRRSSGGVCVFTHLHRFSRIAASRAPRSRARPTPCFSGKYVTISARSAGNPMANSATTCSARNSARADVAQREPGVDDDRQRRKTARHRGGGCSPRHPGFPGSENHPCAQIDRESRQQPADVIA